MIKHESSSAGKKIAVTYTGGVFTNENRQAQLFIGTGGDVNCKLMDDTVAGVMKLSAGYHPLNIKEIIQVSTTASDMYLLL